MRSFAAHALNRPAVLALSSMLLAACASSFKDPGPIRAHASGAYPAIDASRPPLQCVPYARERSGIRIHGDAHTWWTKARGRYETDDEPTRGSVMVMRGHGTDQRGHVAFVSKILTDREIAIDHANWLNRGEIQKDTPVLDVSPDNDWSRVRVWYIPGRHYGGRVYTVQGFIQPKAAESGGLLW